MNILDQDHSEPVADRDPASALLPTAMRMTDAELEAIGRFGEEWLSQNQRLIAELSTRTVVAVRVPDGDFVVGATFVEASQTFHDRFGIQARAWLHRVGVPLRIGGGLWPLSSEA
jgi:hypothetical protein